LHLGLEQSNVSCFPASRVAILKANMKVEPPWPTVDTCIGAMLSSEHVEQNELEEM